MNLRETLRGTGVAVITPFKKDLSVDFEALSKLLDNLIAKGVNYIVTMGTTGEAPVLSSEEKKEIIRYTVQHIHGRVPVVVGIGGNDTASVLHDIDSYPLEGAVAVLSASPYYNKPSQEGIFQHYRVLANACSVPVIVYNVPGRTGRNIEAHTTLRLASEVDNIGGIKEASSNMEQCMEILRDRPENFLVTSGDDALAMPQIACGMDGVISVAANVFPLAFSQMINHSLANNFSEAKKINDELIEGYRLMFAENNPAGAKAFLAEMNMIENVLRLPGVPLSGVLHQQINTYLSRTQIL